MAYLPTNGLPYIEEEEATGEVAERYDKIKRDFQMPFVPNMIKAMAASPEMLALFSATSSAFIEYQTLPESLSSMIKYTIATKSDCTYCSASNELSCRTLGIDHDTLDKLINDLSNLNPERVQVIIDFSLKVAKHAQELTLEDFDRVRDQGVTDGEIIEIIMTAAYSVFVDILADALQVDVENMVSMALDQMR
ncbi:MAG: hypothetical protein IAF02_00745 [Anaerolineae bacterium]|nr:hypothetical protein [Anaerolineae bacterium]